MAKSKPGAGVEGRLENLAGKTPWPAIAVVVSMISAPVTFFLDRGPTLALLLIALATTWWWYDRYVVPIRPARPTQTKRVVSRRKAAFTALIPAALFAVFLTRAYLDVNSLNIFRRNFHSGFVSIENQSTVFDTFGNRPHGSSLQNDDEFDRNLWIRWMDDGAAQTDGTLVFLGSTRFDNNYQRFEVEVHDVSKQSSPVEGVAFLAHDDPDDAWFRPQYRQLPCRPDSDGETRLFRVSLRPPDRNERLYLFLKVKSTLNDKPLPSVDSLPLIIRVSS